MNLAQYLKCFKFAPPPQAGDVVVPGLGGEPLRGLWLPEVHWSPGSVQGKHTFWVMVWTEEEKPHFVNAGVSEEEYENSAAGLC